MKRVAIAFMLLAAGCASGELSGRRVIHDVHDRYTGRRFTHVTFLQRTISPPTGASELWYEAIRPPGLVRVDIAPLEERKGFVYRGDSLYSFEGGRLARAKGDERWISMVLLVDVYDQPADRTIARLTELGVDLSVAHASTWNGRPSVVIGALAGDTASAQAWYDAEHLYPVRIIQPPGGGHPRVEFQVGGHRYLAGGWIETEILVLVGGRAVSRECYGDIRPDADLPDELFDPPRFGEARWAERTYPDVEEPPACPAPSVGLQESRSIDPLSWTCGP